MTNSKLINTLWNAAKIDPQKLYKNHLEYMESN